MRTSHTSGGVGERPGETWHALEGAEVERILATDLARGLEYADVVDRRRRFGPNELPRSRPLGLASRLLRQLRSPLVLLLAAASALAFALGERVDGCVIAGVIAIDAVLGALHEGRAERALDALSRLARARARVVRAGVECEIDSLELVPGDVLLCAAGDAITADARLIEAESLGANESALTGESEPVAKLATSLPHEAPLQERANCLHAGTHLTSGRGRALVVATGLRSELGKLARLTVDAPHVRTPLEQRLASLGRVLAGFALCVFALLLLVGWSRGLPAGELWMIAISQLVSTVPEGLPVALTIALAIGVQRMAARRAIVRRLAAVETLGSTSVICSDKTGTLTCNEMTVTTLALRGGREVAVSGLGYAPAGRLHEHGEPAALDGALRELIVAAVLCNDADVALDADARWVALGDPTEAALAALGRKCGFDVAELRATSPRTAEVPFDPASRRMATEHEAARTIVKGAPEVVLAACLADGEHWLARADELAARGLRVLAVASAPRPLRAGIDSGLRCLGLVAQLDPPRPEAREALATCARAGVRVIMLTGDHRRTAAAVAESLGLQPRDAPVVEGRELERMDDDELARACERVHVFARVQPEHKLRLVEALQRRGEVVAMTGDGVNDAPALVAADVGVAMGRGGTEVARQAADMVVTDDNFRSIVHAVEEGRLVHRNLEKVLLLLLSTLVAEVLVLIAALVLGQPLPLAAVQILWHNVVTEGAVTFNLSLEPPEGDEMHSKPVPRRAPLLSRAMLRRLVPMSLAIAAVTWGWLAWGTAAGRELAEVRTGAFLALTVCDWFNLLNCRSATRSVFSRGQAGNRWLFIGLLASVALQLLVMYVPLFAGWFHAVPLPLEQVVAIVALASCVLWIEEARKFLARRRSQGSTRSGITRK
jgi:Ca2+-transporting ATPase